MTISLTVTMLARFLLGLLSAATIVVAGPSPKPKPGGANQCRNIPGDAGWPATKEWQKLNSTVGGRLVATVPLGHVCHTAGVFGAFDEKKCADLGGAIMNAGAQTL